MVTMRWNQVPAGQTLLPEETDMCVPPASTPTRTRSAPARRGLGIHDPPPMPRAAEIALRRVGLKALIRAA